MGKTWKRRDPYARDLRKPQYRQRRKGDKRKKIIEALDRRDSVEYSEVICFKCRGRWPENCTCVEPVVTKDEAEINKDRQSDVSSDRAS